MYAVATPMELKADIVTFSASLVIIAFGFFSDMAITKHDNRNNGVPISADVNASKNSNANHSSKCGVRLEVSILNEYMTAIITPTL